MSKYLVNIGGYDGVDDLGLAIRRLTDDIRRDKLEIMDVWKNQLDKYISKHRIDANDPHGDFIGTQDLLNNTITKVRK